jgi:hypothetical protein
MPDQDRFDAGVSLLQRTGARQFQIRYSDDEEPVVWIAVGGWPKPESDSLTHVAAAALAPSLAVLALCEKVIDGGACVHCGRATVFLPTIEDVIPGDTLCRYQYDPELKTFRRDCEGDERSHQ